MLACHSQLCFALSQEPSEGLNFKKKTFLKDVNEFSMFTRNWGRKLSIVAIQFGLGKNTNKIDDVEMLTSEMHDPYTRTTGA